MSKILNFTEAASKIWIGISTLSQSDIILIQFVFGGTMSCNTQTMAVKTKYMSYMYTVGFWHIYVIRVYSWILAQKNKEVKNKEAKLNFVSVVSVKGQIVWVESV